MSSFLRLYLVAQDCVTDYQKGGCMNSMLIDSKGSTIYQNEWESILGRLDAITDEINRALRRSTGMESGLLNPHKMVDAGRKQRHLAVMAEEVRQ